MPARREFEIDLPIAVRLDRERSRARGHRLSEVDPAGKRARTLVTCVAAGTGFSVLRCRPRTGRQNQIRAHLAAVGHPILGDIGYGSIPLGGDDAPPFPERPLLHSAALNFPHPVWGTHHVLRAPPPADFRPFILSSHPPDEPPRIVFSEMEEG